MMKHDVPLAPFTTFGVGGPARVLAQPQSVEDLVAAIAYARTEGLPYRMLGGGSNLLIPDEGFDGVVVRTRGLRRRTFFGDGVEVEGGASFPLLVKETVDRGLRGIEALCGIPGTVAGALAMNAGGRHGEIKDVVEWVDALDDEGAVRRLRRDEIEFRYRETSLKGRVILSCRLRLEPGDPAALSARRREVQSAKEATQPLSSRTAGCMFRNPPGGSAGRMIEACGLKGTRAGGARISELHANFIVNDGGATARDIESLAELARARVLDRFGVRLVDEVIRWS